MHFFFSANVENESEEFDECEDDDYINEYFAHYEFTEFAEKYWKKVKKLALDAGIQIEEYVNVQYLSYDSHNLVMKECQCRLKPDEYYYYNIDCSKDEDTQTPVVTLGYKYRYAEEFARGYEERYIWIKGQFADEDYNELMTDESGKKYGLKYIDSFDHHGWSYDIYNLLEENNNVIVLRYMSEDDDSCTYARVTNERILERVRTFLAENYPEQFEV